ncbi:hypothetical protein U9M48_042824, partial [Paspalum notatum var. saurae]
LKSGDRVTRKRSVTYLHHCHRSSPLPPPIFTTTTDPLDANDWLRIIESKFSLLPRLSEQQKARFAAQCLRGPSGPGALHSWQCNQPGTRSRGMSSVQLFGLTISRLASSSSSNGNFVHFNEGTCRYSSTCRLSSACPNVDTDMRRAARLLGGFDPTLLTHLGRRYDSFIELVNAAIDMEHRLRGAQEDQQRKKLASTPPPGSSQQQRVTHRAPPHMYYIDMPQP